MAASVKECLQLQLLEMEMLFSMFPNQGEVKLEDANALSIIKQYVEGTRKALPPKIEFVITLSIEEPKVSGLCSFIVATFPYFYWKHWKMSLVLKETVNNPSACLLICKSNIGCAICQNYLEFYINCTPYNKPCFYFSILHLSNISPTELL